MTSIRSSLTRAVVVALVVAGGVATVPAASASAAPGPRAVPFELASSSGVTSTLEQEPVVVDPELQLSGPRGRLVRGAVVRIAEGATDSDELLFDDQGAIDGSFAGRRLLLRGSAPARIYQRALRSVEFVHRGDQPGSPSMRSIRFTLIGHGGVAASKPWRSSRWTTPRGSR